MTSLNAKRPRCTSTKADGSPCTNKAKAGSDRCGAHGGKIGAPVKLPSDRIAGGDESQTYSQVIAGLASVGLSKHRIARQVQMAPALLAQWWERGEADFENGIESEFRDFYLQFEHGRVLSRRGRVFSAGPPTLH